jgi:putative FmdB family regulatory protein
LPIYVYQCHSCGLRFEKLWKTASQAVGKDAMDCRECGDEAKKQVTAANHTFAHKPTGPVPQNTGVHSIDYSYDRVIGRDAAEKWKVINERKAEKDRVLSDAPDKDKNDLRRTHEGGYEVMKPAERDMSARGRALTELAQKRAAKARPKSTAKSSSGQQPRAPQRPADTP